MQSTDVMAIWHGNELLGRTRLGKQALAVSKRNDLICSAMQHQHRNRADGGNVTVRTPLVIHQHARPRKFVISDGIVAIKSGIHHHRLDARSIATLFELCERLDMQLIIAAPENISPEKGTTYKLVRKVFQNSEHVHVVGLRGFAPQPPESLPETTADAS